MLILALCVLCLVCLWWVKSVRNRTSGQYKLPPAYPNALPILGHTHKLLRDTLGIWDFIRDVASDCVKQGGVTHIQIGTEIYYLITDPQDSLTAANTCLTKHFAFDFAKPWVGDGLATAKGEIWKRHRKLLSPAFTLPVIHGFQELFNSQAKTLLKEMDQYVGKGPFNQTISLRNFALETLCIGTFGVNVLGNRSFTHKYMEAVDEFLRLMTERVHKLWLHNDLIYKLIGPKKKERALIDTMDGMKNEILQKKQSAMNRGEFDKPIEYKTSGIKYMPLMDLLLELLAEGSLSEQEIRNEIDTNIAAGFETSANQLTYTLLFLGSHPEVQEKLYKEIMEVVGPERDVEKDDINKLVYMNAILMESLRLLPSIPLLPRYVDKDVKLKNYTMRAGYHCVIFPLCTQADSCWGPEAHQFRPERWLDTDTLNNKDFPAFGLGKRACIGRTYAIISMKVCLAHLIRSYKVFSDYSKLKLKYEFMLKPHSGYEISIERRE